MARIKCMPVAAAFMVASVMVKANQCSSDGECLSDDEPQNIVSLLQQKLQMKKAQVGGKERAAAQKQAKKTLPVAEDSFIEMVAKANPTAASSLAAEVKAAPEKDAAESSPFFWQMSRAQQKSVSLSSLVYVMGGLLIAMIFNQVREKHFAPDPMPESAADSSTEGFKFPLFGCFSDMKLCVLGCCCPCLAWANNLDQRKILSYWPALFAFFGLLVLDLYTAGIASLFMIAIGVYYRQKLRERHSTAGSCFSLVTDILSWTCCQPCAIIQEAREEITDEKQNITDAQ